MFLRIDMSSKTALPIVSLNNESHDSGNIGGSECQWHIFPVFLDLKYLRKQVCVPLSLI